MPKSKAVATQARSNLTRLDDHAKAFDTLMQRTGAREIVSDRVKLRLDTPGDYVIGLLDGIREGGKNGEHFRIYDFTFPGNNVGFLLGTGQLDQKINGALAGHVLGIMLTGEQDIGQASPMKLYRVVDFGDTYPAGITKANCVAIAKVDDAERDADSSGNGVADEDDLPF